MEGPLPGITYLLPRGLEKKAAGILAHGSSARAATLAGEKGATTVAHGINPFTLPAPSAPGTGVASDGSLGSGAVSYSNGKYSIPAAVGMQKGGNLFESFSQFNLLQGEIADFQGPSSVEDIIARVTGGNASSIDGTIESDIQGANLFLINPAGVMFGPDASLNVSGAFTVSTADYVKLADGGKFNASLTANDTSLTAGPVSAFGFLSSTPAPVSFSGSQLSVPVDTGLNVIAGNVTLDSPSGDTTTPGANLSAPSGELAVFSGASAGEVPFSLGAPGAGFGTASFSGFGKVSLSAGSSLAIDGLGGGELVIRAGSLSVDDSTISSINSGSIAGGNISVQTGGVLSVLDGGGIDTEAESSGQGGNISITAAGEVSLNQGYVWTSTDGAGATGNVTIVARGELDMEAGGQINSVTVGTGAAGTINIRAGSITIAGESQTPAGQPLFYSGIFANDQASQSTGAPAGTIIITTPGTMTFEGGGLISASTFQPGSVFTSDKQPVNIFGNVGGSLGASGGAGISGNGGDITIRAASIQLLPGQIGDNGDGGIVAFSELSPSIPGRITVWTNTMGIYGAEDIQSVTFGSAPGGSVAIHVLGQIIISGVSAGLDAASQAYLNGGANAGRAGNLSIDAGALQVLAGGIISTTTFGAGAGGVMTIDAGSVDISGLGSPDLTPEYVYLSQNLLLEISTSLLGPAAPTGLAALSLGVASGPSGRGGDILIRTNKINITNNGFISSISTGIGDAGNITIDTGGMYISRGEVPYRTGIASGTESIDPAATGNGGVVTVDATGSVVVTDGGEISALSSTAGSAGTVNITAATFDLENGGQITSASTSSAGGGVAGDIQIRCQNLFLDDEAHISTNAASNNAGEITVSVGSNATMEGESSISSSAGVNGGDITLNVGGDLYVFDGSISATAGALTIRNGVSSVNAGAGGDIILDPNFIFLDDALISANAAIGQGGNIVLQSNYYFNSGSAITATGATSGTIIITSPELDLSAALIGLPSAPVGSETRLQETCQVAINGDFSSFLAVGQGDVEAAPDEPQGETGDLQRRAGHRITAHHGKPLHPPATHS